MQEATKKGGLAIRPTAPESVQKLQTTLYAEGKDSSGFRSYALTVEVFRKDVPVLEFDRDAPDTILDATLTRDRTR